MDLNEVSKRHSEWIRIAMYLCSNEEQAREAVQEMYLKLGEIQVKEGSLNRIRYGNDINKAYIYKTIQNIIVDRSRMKKHIEINDTFVDESSTIPETEYNQLIDCFADTIQDLREYEQYLLELHFYYGFSMRTIERETGVATHSIFNSLKNVKQKIKQTCTTEYIRYKENSISEVQGIRRFSREDPSKDRD